MSDAKQVVTENALLRAFTDAHDDTNSDDYYGSPIIAKNNLNSGACWGKSGTNYFGIDEHQYKLDPAVYRSYTDNSGKVFFKKMNINTDQLIVLPDTSSELVIDSIEHFWRSKEVFNTMGFLWKRGFLLHGPPGSGKTSTIQQIIVSMINKGGIVIYCTNPTIDVVALAVLRNIEPDRPIVFIMEDIDAIIKNYDESIVLSLLDGEVQITNVVYIATTNYPETLDDRIINRPSRFDFIQKIDAPSADARRIFLKHKNPNIKDEATLNLWVNVTKDFSIAHLKELIVSVECLGNDFDESVKRLRKMMDNKPTSDEPTGNFGFCKNEED